MHSARLVSLGLLALVAAVVTVGGCTEKEAPDRAPPERIGESVAAMSESPIDATASPVDAGACRTFELVATKRYRPSRYQDDERAFDPPALFAMPAALDVTEGNGANHALTLQFRRPGADRLVACRYRGGARSSNPHDPVDRARGLQYLFQACDDPAGIRAGELVRADFVRLHVDGGSNQEPIGRTTVRLSTPDLATCSADAGTDASDAHDETGIADADAPEDGPDDADVNDAADATAGCTAAACDDGNPCTDDACGSDGQCVHPPRPAGTACSDGNACNGVESCDGAGVCTAGVPPVVDDDNPCTIDTCDPATGAAHASAAAGTSCADGNVCNGAETCDGAGVCKPGVPLVADTSNRCLADTCDPVRGITYVPLAAGTACSDSNACNGLETCDGAGTCLGGSAPPLDDGNPCTADACDSTTGVTHVPVAAGTSCSDGNACNGAESCDGAGACAAGSAPPVDDGNPCTVDACSPSTGVTHAPAALGTSCSDGNACNGAEACNGAGVCGAGVTPVADDGNPCTVDVCDPVQGVIHTPAAAGTSCSDGNACNGAEACNGAGVCGAGVAPVADDGNPCTVDVCDPVQGVIHTPAAAGTSCSDGNACNGAEACNATGTCVVGTVPLLDDGNPCTVDACDAASGVSHIPAAAGTSCADTDACNGVEACNGAGACVVSTPPPAVDDGNPCTVDRCDAALGVVHEAAAAGASCADADTCNGDEVCDGRGRCAAGTPPLLDDANPCTDDTCDPARGVLHAAKAPGSLCSDSNACNGLEVCSAAGDCLSGTPPVVDDGNVCTRDTCDPATGVRHDPLAGCDPTPTHEDAPLETRASLIGRVVTSTGAALDGAAISVFDVPAVGAPRADVAVTRTSGGAFRVRLTSFPETEGPHAPAQRVILRVDAPDAIPVTRAADLRPGSIADLGTIVVARRDPAVTTIGPSGGTASDSRGMVSVTIPAGALATDTPIRITPFLTREELPHPLPDVTITTYAFELEPDGLQFPQPVTVRIANTRNLPTDIELPVGSVDRPTGRWRDEGAARWDAATGTFAFQATHFSTWDANPSPSGVWVYWVSPGTDPSHAAAACGFGSAVGLANGTLRQTIELPATVRHDRAYAVGFTYDSFSGASVRLAPASGSTPGHGGAGAPIPMTTFARSVAPLSVRGMCLTRGEADRVQSTEPGSCTVGGCQWSVYDRRTVTLETLGHVEDLGQISRAGEADVGSFLPLPGDPSGGVAQPSFVPQKLTISSRQDGACIARAGAAFAQPLPPPAPFPGELLEVSVPSVSDPNIVIERSVFVHHRLTSPFGTGWSVDGLRRLYANDQGAGADEAILVHANGEQERFTPRASVSGVALPSAGFPVFARDTTTGEVFIATHAGAIHRLEPDGTETPIQAGIALGGQTVRALAVAHVGGARRFLLMLDDKLVDVDPAGNVRTLSGLTQRPGSMEFSKTSGIAAWGDVAYFTDGRPPNRFLWRVRLDTETPSPENLTAPEGAPGNIGLDPQRPLREVRFGDPKGIALGRDGALYVADRLRSVVYRVKPEAAGGIGPSSHVELALGDGDGRQLLPIGVRREARAFSLNQPVALSQAPDGTLYVLSVAGVAAFDVAAERAKWVFAPGNRPDSDLAYLSFAWTSRMQLLGLDANAFLVSVHYSIHRVDVTPYASESDPTRTLSRDAQGFVLTDTTADIQEAYDAKGRLRERRTRPGDVLARFEYDGATSDRLAKIIDAAGGETVFAYDARKKLESITDPAGRTTTFEIDDRGDLVKITTPSSPGKEPEVRSFVYDKHRMTKKVAARGDETTYEWRDDGTLRATHKATGESYSDIQPALAQRYTDASGEKFAQGSYVDPHGVRHEVLIDRNGAVARETYVADGTSYTVAAAYAQDLGYGGPYLYDVRTNKLRRISGIRVNDLAVGEDTHFDVMGRPMASALVSHPTAGYPIYRYAYRQDGRLDRISNATGETAVRFAYDASGRLAKTWEWFGHNPTYERAVKTFSWRPDGLLASRTSAGVTTTYAYDAAGNTVGATDNAGRVTTLERDPLTGLVTRASDGVASTRYAYDLSNRLTAITDGAGNTTRLGYTQLPCGCREEDRVTRLETPDLPADLAWTFDYGPEGRIVAATDPSGETQRYEYSATTNELTRLIDRRGRVTTLAYDALGRVRASVDPLRRTFGRSYATPAASGLTGGSVLGATAPGAPDGTVAKTGLASRLDVGEYQLGTTAFDASASRSRGLPTVTFYRDATLQVSYAHGYDAFGRLAQRDDRGATPVDNPETNGFLYQSTSRVSDGIDWASGFFDVVQAHRVRTPGTTRATTYQLTPNFDPSVVGGVGSSEQSLTVVIERDAFQRPRTLARSFFGNVNLSGAATTSTYTYYANGRLQSVEGPAGKRTLHYDARGLVERVDVDGEGTYAFHYDAIGRSDRVTYPDGHRRVQQYDVNGRLRERCYEYLDAAGERDAARTRCYGADYDANGSPTKLRDPEGEDAIETDDLDRLTRVTRGAEVQEYAYNALGAVKRNASVVLDDQRPRLGATGTADAAVPASAGGQPVTLDVAGRVTSLRGSTLDYAAGSRIASATTGAATERFAYDGALRRFARTVGPNDPTNRIFIHEGDELTAVLNPAGLRVEDYLYDGIDHPLRIRRGTTVVYYELDLAGNVRRLRAPGGADLGGYRYTAFGKTLETNASFDQMLRWKGRPFVDVAGGLYDMRARWWSPDLAAFTSIDELVFHDAASTLWGWPGQNPIAKSDPTGRDGAAAAFAGWFAGAGAGAGSASGGATGLGLGATAGLALSAAALGAGAVVYAVYDISVQMDQFYHPTVIHSPATTYAPVPYVEAGRKGERGATAKPDGTANPGKKFRFNEETGRWEYKDPHTGKWIPKPPGFKPPGIGVLAPGRWGDEDEDGCK